jgi:hypothetical protein
MEGCGWDVYGCVWVSLGVRGWREERCYPWLQSTELEEGRMEGGYSPGGLTRCGRWCGCTFCIYDGMQADGGYLGCLVVPGAVAAVPG